MGSLTPMVAVANMVAIRPHCVFSPTILHSIAIFSTWHFRECWSDGEYCDILLNLICIGPIWQTGSIVRNSLSDSACFYCFLWTPDINQFYHEASLVHPDFAETMQATWYQCTLQGNLDEMDQGTKGILCLAILWGVFLPRPMFSDTGLPMRLEHTELTVLSERSSLQEWLAVFTTAAASGSHCRKGACVPIRPCPGPVRGNDGQAVRSMPQPHHDASLVGVHHDVSQVEAAATTWCP